jgi:hypothetical protein
MSTRWQAMASNNAGGVARHCASTAIETDDRHARRRSSRRLARAA